tara:strand:+ start:264 stop:641 length:378 start_codon:yes stop_codon:yes gene_type:complete
MAEGILKNEASDKFEVFSAGSHPSHLHPAAVSVMKEWGIDISYYKSENINSYFEKNIDIVITVCDNANQSCPNFPSGKIRIHWNIKDPFHGWGNEKEDLPPYRSARNELKKRIVKLLSTKDIELL